MISLEPRGPYVVLERIHDPEMTEGGVLLPDQAQRTPVRAMVLAVGDGKTTDKGVRIPVGLKPGDIVLHSQFGGVDVAIEGRKLLVLDEAHIYCVLRKA